jgi:putative Mn2+ efflux pump MntP
MEIIRELSRKRVVQMRKNGLIKIISGILMVCVPVVGWFAFNAAGIIPMKLFAIMIMLGLWGAYRVLKGTFMVVAPNAQQGDVSEQ